MSRFDVERFDPPPDEELICCICQGVLDHPMETPCRHVFCKVCIETWLRNGRANCPTCRAAATPEKLCTALPLLKNLLHKQRFFCANRANGCQLAWLIENFDQEHDKTCEFRLVSCQHTGCKQQIQSRYISKHEDKCEYRSVICKKLCGLRILAKNKSSHACLPLLKETIEDLKKKLQDAHQEIERLRSRNSDLQRQLSEQNNSQTDSDSGAGSATAWNQDHDQNSSSSINDFLMSSSSDQNSYIDDINSNSPAISDRSDNNDSLTDSMVGFSESEGNASPLFPIMISSDSSSGYHTHGHAPLISPPPPHMSPGSQRHSDGSIYHSDNSQPRPESASGDSNGQERTPIYSGSSYSDNENDRDTDGGLSAASRRSCPSSSRDSDSEPEPRVPPLKLKRQRTASPVLTDGSTDTSDSSVHGSPRNKRAKRDEEYYYEESYRHEEYSKSASSQSTDSDDF